MGRGALVVFVQVMHTKSLDICYDFGAVMNLIFSTTPFWGSSTTRGQR